MESVTAIELGIELGCSKSTIYSWIKKRLVNIFLKDEITYIKRDDLLAERIKNIGNRSGSRRQRISARVEEEVRAEIVEKELNKLKAKIDPNNPNPILDLKIDTLIAKVKEGCFKKGSSNPQWAKLTIALAELEHKRNSTSSLPPEHYYNIIKVLLEPPVGEVLAIQGYTGNETAKV